MWLNNGSLQRAHAALPGAFLLQPLSAAQHLDFIPDGAVEDVLSEACQLPRLEIGDVLAFSNAGAYGQWASATNFHGYPLPAEALFDGGHVTLLREPQPASSILNGQRHVPGRTATQI